MHGVSEYYKREEMVYIWGHNLEENFHKTGTGCGNGKLRLERLFSIY